MDLIFKGTECATRRIRIGVRGNNIVDKLCFVIDRYPQDDIDLTKFTPYIKLENRECGYLDKDSRVEVQKDDEMGTLRITYALRQKTTRCPTASVQLQFEHRDEVGKPIAIWQTETVSVEFRRTVPADEEIEDVYPGVVQDLADRVATLEGLKNVAAATREDFPKEGSEDVIYIAKQENRLYRYDPVKGDYIVFDPEWAKIKFIDGGKPNARK